MKFDYRIPKIHIVMFMGFSLLFILGSQGYLGNSFAQDAFTRVFAVLVLFVLTIWIINSPRNRHIVVDDAGIDIPSVLFPPYGSSFISWSEIVDVYSRPLIHSHTIELIVQTKAKKYKIKSWLIQENYEIGFRPENFYKIESEIRRRRVNRKYV